MDGYIFTIYKHGDKFGYSFDSYPIIAQSLEEAEMSTAIRYYRKRNFITKFKTTLNMEKFFKTGFC